MIHGEVKTKPGFWVNCAPWIVIPITATEARIGQAVIDALAQSKCGVPVPEPSELKKLKAARLKAAGIQSERRFMNGALLVSIHRLNETIKFCPTKNGGTRGDQKGFEELPDNEIEIQADSDIAQIGKTLVEVWRLCT